MTFVIVWVGLALLVFLDNNGSLDGLAVVEMVSYSYSNVIYLHTCFYLVNRPDTFSCLPMPLQ